MSHLVERERRTEGPSAWTAREAKSGHYVYLVERGTLRVELGGRRFAAARNQILWVGARVVRRLAWGEGSAATAWVVRIRNRALSLTSEADLEAWRWLLRLGRLGEQVGPLPCLPSTAEAIRSLVSRSAGHLKQEAQSLLAQKALLLGVLECLVADSRLSGALSDVDGLALVTPGLARAIQYMEDHSEEAVSTPDLARMAGLSRSHFHRLFRAALPTTPRAYLRRIRVDRAARLLQGTDRTVLDVAMATGFGSVSRMYAAFHEVLGRPPGALRKEPPPPPAARPPRPQATA